MFYYNNWDDFCSWIKDCGLTTCTAGHSLHIGHNTRFVVLKHDVESDVARAYRLAEIECLQSEIEDREAELKDLRAQLEELMAG